MGRGRDVFGARGMGELLLSVTRSLRLHAINLFVRISFVPISFLMLSSVLIRMNSYRNASAAGRSQHGH